MTPTATEPRRCHCGCGRTDIGRKGWVRGHDSRALRRARQRFGGLAELLAAAERGSR